MSALEASSAGIKDMADGSLRITIEFDPRFAKEAFALFGARGTPLAIAALKVGYAAADNQVTFKKEDGEKPKGGALAKLAGMWCNDPLFWEWLETDPLNCAPGSTGAALCLYDICGIKSRVELDNDPQAAERFHRLIRGPYSKYMAAKGV